MNILTTDQSIPLWWEKPDAPPEQYTILLNGKAEIVTDRTHVTLTPDTEYEIEVVGIDIVQARTRPRITHIDVTRSPHLAKGDGRTLNTAALQKAIDDCGPNQCMYCGFTGEFDYVSELGTHFAQ